MRSGGRAARGGLMRQGRSLHVYVPPAGSSLWARLRTAGSCNWPAALQLRCCSPRPGYLSFDSSSPSSQAPSTQAGSAGCQAALHCPAPVTLCAALQHLPSLLFLLPHTLCALLPPAAAVPRLHFTSHPLLPLPPHTAGGLGGRLLGDMLVWVGGGVEWCNTKPYGSGGEWGTGGEWGSCSPAFVAAAGCSLSGTGGAALVSTCLWLGCVYGGAGWGGVGPRGW